MDAAAAINVYPFHRTKTIHLVRHAQGFHNLNEDIDSLLSEEFFDARLTPLGWEQVDTLRKHVQSSRISKKIELVITSPPVKGIFPNGRRRSISEYRHLYPAIDFSMIEHDEDVLWKQDVIETSDEMTARGLKFLKWLLTRKEKEIAVVSHSGFLSSTMKVFGDDCDIFIQSEIRKSFGNAELRSIVLIDRSRIGSDSSSTNFPGGIPRGLDLPIDIAIEKNPEFQKHLKHIVNSS